MRHGVRAPGASWFFGLPVDGAFMATRVPEVPPGFRRFHPEDLHLTVAFLGACGEEAARRALAVLERALSSPRPPIEASLGEVVPMGDPRAYSALSALLLEGRAETEALIGALRDPLADAAGARRETREPKPHLTLARPSRGASEAQRGAGLAWARGLDLGGVRARLDRVALYTWSAERRDTWSAERQARLFEIVAERRLG